jgi:hypothetical protein
LRTIHGPNVTEASSIAPPAMVPAICTASSRLAG